MYIKEVYKGKYVESEKYVIEQKEGPPNMRKVEYYIVK